MNDEIIKLHKDLASRALYGFYRNRFATIEVAVEWCVGEAVPEFSEGKTFREILLTYKVLVQEVQKWTENRELQAYAKEEAQKYKDITSGRRETVATHTMDT